MDIQLSKEKRQELLQKKNVVAVGIGYKEINGKPTNLPCVICSVKQKELQRDLQEKDIIPHSVEGSLTDVKLTGEIRALRTRKYRPAPGGVSIGHIYITAGTLGGLVKRGDDIFILSNNHVLANCNRGKKGDTIIQPGTHDGGIGVKDKIAELHDFIPINFSNGGESDCFLSGILSKGINLAAKIFNSRTRFKAIKTSPEVNFVDAALAKPLFCEDVIPTIWGLGAPFGKTSPTLGMEVVKSGRTTGVTTGKIQQVQATVKVNFGSDGEAIFENQVISDIWSDGGDSGSLVLEKDTKKATGLLFAGSVSVTVLNNINCVCDSLNIEIY